MKCDCDMFSQDCEQQANEGKFRLRDLLVVPMQRIMKYALLLNVSPHYTTCSYSMVHTTNSAVLCLLIHISMCLLQSHVDQTVISCNLNLELPPHAAMESIVW